MEEDVCVGGEFTVGFPLQFLRFAAGAVEPIPNFEGQPIASLSVSPDFRSLLYSKGEEMKADIMLFENFR